MSQNATDPRALEAAPPRSRRGRPIRFVATTPSGDVDLFAEMLRADHSRLYVAAMRHADKLIEEQGKRSGYTGKVKLTKAELREWRSRATAAILDIALHGHGSALLASRTDRGPAATASTSLIRSGMRDAGRDLRLAVGRAMSEYTEATLACLDQTRATDLLLRAALDSVSRLVGEDVRWRKTRTGVWKAA